MANSAQPMIMVLRALGIVLLSLVGITLLAVIVVVVGFFIADRTNGSLVSSGETRRYLIHVPKTINPAAPAALVISLHGFSEWPAHQAHISRWNELADREGFIVVYPSGTKLPRRWQAFPTDSGNGFKDVVFINDLIDQLSKQYNIDPGRIYANGLSNGGGMSYLLGCKLSDRIAAIGGVAGAYIYPQTSCQPARPVPMILFHGKADPIVPYTGGPSHSFAIPFPNIPAWAEKQADLNGCDLQPAAIPVSENVSGVHYTGCNQAADVVFYTIMGGGHTWPGGNPLPVWITGYTNMEISATETMWEFFKQYRLPATPE